jgi:hypothetical protein
MYAVSEKHAGVEPLHVGETSRVAHSNLHSVCRTKEGAERRQAMSTDRELLATPSKLDSGQKHLLRLVAKDAKADGWANASYVVYRLIDKTIPRALVELYGSTDIRRIRLTPLGQQLLHAMEWL